MTHRVNRRARIAGGCNPSSEARNRLIAIKTKLAFDGLRMIKSLIGIPALLRDT
jgi:hypothetical protein